eukprot:TRINITY_DN19082_c0_g2_i1.p1 TRINITY_DN19082_c0_g2~~TRINITY_DN19082_c0_g2_i1.p1  ORF type:complete len:220 (+),score=13.21 TRINITY_DN19082_c0_g2_i1:47-661(+)
MASSTSLPITGPDANEVPDTSLSNGLSIREPSASSQSAPSSSSAAYQHDAYGSSSLRSSRKRGECSGSSEHDSEGAKARKRGASQGRRTAAQLDGNVRGAASNKSGDASSSPESELMLSSSNGASIDEPLGGVVLGMLDNLHRGRLPSVGSDRHALGDCRPCTFLRTGRGCLEGLNCQFCHFPHSEASSAKLRRLGDQRRSSRD